MIPASEIISSMESQLDAEDSDRYLFDTDYKPAINNAIGWLTALFHSALETRKVSSENLRELIRTRVFQPNKFGRVMLSRNELGHGLLYVVAVNPEAKVDPDVGYVWGGVETSHVRDDLIFITSDHSAANLTYEEWWQNKRNIFKKGNESVTGELKTYAYLNMRTTPSDFYYQVEEIEVRPNPYENKDYVGVTYIKEPSKIQNDTDNIEFPWSVREMIVERALNFIAVKQGDQTTLYGISGKEVGQLSQLLT